MEDGGAEADGAGGAGLVGGDGAAADGPVLGVAGWEGLDAVLDGVLDCEQPSIANPSPTNSPGIKTQFFLRSISTSLLHDGSMTYVAWVCRVYRLFRRRNNITATIMPLRVPAWISITCA